MGVITVSMGGITYNANKARLVFRESFSDNYNLRLFFTSVKNFFQQKLMLSINY